MLTTYVYFTAMINDILGLFTDFVPKYSKQYAKLNDIIQNAITEYYEVRKDET